jgi:DNA polymerase III alpha subunit
VKTTVRQKTETTFVDLAEKSTLRVLGRVSTLPTTRAHAVALVTSEKWTRVSNKAEKSPLRQKDIRTGAQQERKRIIAMLEKLRDSEYAEVMTHDDLIALIKGENE